MRINNPDAEVPKNFELASSKGCPINGSEMSRKLWQKNKQENFHAIPYSMKISRFRGRDQKSSKLKCHEK